MKSFIIKIIIVSSLACAAVATNADAQSNMSVISWNITIPRTNYSEFIDEVSYRGFSIEGRKFKGRHATIGISLAWQVLDQETFSTFHKEKGDVGLDLSGENWRYSNMFPILLTAHYHMRRDGETRPYFGVGAGAYYIKERVDIGVYQINESDWHFGVAPEVGLLFPAGYGTEIMIGAKYNYVYQAGDSPTRDWFNVLIGLSSSR